MRVLTPLFSSLPLLIGAVAALPASAAAQAKHLCTYCHDLHGAGYSALNARDVQVDLCQWCHDPDGGQGTTIDGKTIPKQGRNADPLSGFVDHIGVRASDGWQPSCWNCHDHEGDADSTTTSTWVNLKMIAATIKDPANGARPVIFTQWSGDSSFADADTTALVGVCETCHTEVERHRNTTDFPSGWPANDRRHNADADCTGCHKHDSGFEGRGGGCAGCHAGGQSGEHVRRPVTPEFDRSTFHIDWVAAGGGSSADIIDDDCLVCHVQEGNHPGEGSTGTGHNVALRHGDDGSTIILTGDPNTSTAAAQQLTPFCLSCHRDGEDSTGDPNPFSDAIDIPVLEGGAVDSLFWVNSSSHGTGSISCYGDGAFGCHASHGSEKSPMLALQPAAAPDSGSSGNILYYEQEGFCFNCHRSGGTSTKTIRDQFATTITFAQEGAGLQSSVLLNDRHDVQHAAQAVSGAAIECVSCHNPHRATPTQKVVVDPDPGDGIVPAIGARVAWGGIPAGIADYMTEWCLDCHDNSFPAGVQPSTVGLTNIADLWNALGSGDKHGSNERGNNSLDVEPISDWIKDIAVIDTTFRRGQIVSIDTTFPTNSVLPCQACHAPHPSTQSELNGLVTTEGRTAAINNLFQVKPFVTKRDGFTLIRPDSDHPEFGTHTQVTNNASSAAEIERGEGLCYTCHYLQMQNTNCFRCHYHGTGNLF
jgi:hypothetical protein